MAGVGLKFQMNDLAPELSKVTENLADVTPLLDEVGAALDSDAVQRFQNEQAPDGEKWAQSQRAKDDGGLTLTDSGNLSNSITHFVSGNTLEHGAGEIYSAIQHFGGKTGRNKSVDLPSRPIIGMAETQRLSVEQILLDWGIDNVS
jgi:phage virion morphogenesis protein